MRTNNVLCIVLMLGVLYAVVPAQGTVTTYMYKYCGSDTAMFTKYVLHYLRYYDGTYWIPQVAFVPKNCSSDEQKVDSCVLLQCGEMYELNLQSMEEPLDLVPSSIEGDSNEWLLFSKLNSEFMNDGIEVFSMQTSLFFCLTRNRSIPPGWLANKGASPIFYTLLNVCGDCLYRPRKRIPEGIHSQRNQMKRSKRGRR